MPESASPASESSKAVPVGEPPTPEGWTMEQVMEAQADLQSALGLLRLNGWGQPQEDYLVRSLARLHGMLDALGSPMYDAETHSEVRVAPVGGAGRSDVDSLPDGRGFTREDRNRVARLVGRLPHVMTVDADDCAGAILAVLEPRVRLSEEEASTAADWIMGHRPSREDELEVGRILDGVVRKLRASVGEGEKDG